MKKKIVVLNVILIVYILSMSVGYAIFSEALTVKGVASTVEYYSGTNLPVTAQVRDTTNNLYHTATGTDILEYESESWQDDTYEVNYIKNSTGTSGSTASFTVSFENAAVLDISEGQISTDANSLAQVNNPVVIDNESNKGVVMPLVLNSNSSKLKAVANTNITASATISKALAAPNEIVDVTVTVGLDSLTAGVNESVTATVAYMLQNKIRYFYFKVNLKDACLAKGHDYNTVETAPSYSGRGYYTHTCTRCGNSYTENSNTELYLINNRTFVNQSAWGSAFVNTSSSKINGSSVFGGVVNSIATLAVSHVNNYGVMYTGPINLTDAKSIVFSYEMYDNLYKTQTVNDPNDTSFACKYLNSCNKITQTQKGINTTYVGFTSNNGNNTTYAKSSSVTYTRSSSSDAVKTGTITIDASGYSGSYYIKVYVKHSYSGTQISTANTAYTGFSSIKIIYN